MDRPMAVAGQFYPEDKEELQKALEKFFLQARIPEIKGEIFGLLLPHAGYLYSGQVAAYGFKAVAGRKFDTVVIIGDSHHERFDGVSFWPEGFWQTPLGQIAVDEKLAQKIMSGSDRFFQKDSAHLWEHALEAQLPFLQSILEDFKIVPIIFGSEDEDWRKLAQTIYQNIRSKKVLVIASADLSHYLPYDQAQEADTKTLENISGLKTDDLNVCAVDSVRTIIELAKLKKGRAQLLKYANSGDVSGDRSKVVGYGAVAFYS